MPEKMSHASLVQAMERRFDYQSARNILMATLQELELGEKPEYEQAEVTRIAEFLMPVYIGADKVAAAIKEYFEPEPEPVPVAEPPAAEPPPAEAAAAEEVAESKEGGDGEGKSEKKKKK